MNALALSFNDIQLSPINHNSQIWLTSIELAKSLGYAQENAVTKIFNRYKDEFTDNMSVIIPVTQIGSLGESSGLQREQRIFSLRGCHLLAMFARTAVAKEFRKWVLDILENHKNLNYGLKQLPPPKTKLAVEGGLTLETQDDIKAIIQNMVANYPKDKQTKMAISLWSALGTHFGIKKEDGDKTPAYKYISEEHRIECFSLLARLTMDNVVTITQAEYDQLKALPKPVDEELLSNQLTVTFSSKVLDSRWTMFQVDDRFVIKPMQRGQFVTSSDKLADLIADSMGMAVEFKDLGPIAEAAIRRMNSVRHA